MWPQLLEKIIDRQDLTAGEAEQMMNLIMAGQATPVQVAGYLVALRMKGVAVSELVGSARAMRAHATPVRSSHLNLVDTCGTGGDGARTFNISTVAALVVAAAGVPVAKHGNRSVSSRCGSADVLEGLGVHIDLPAAALGQCLDEVGFAFLYAPRLHSGFRHAALPRRELGVRTIFNVLGPLTNPAGARFQLMGVYSAELVPPVAEALAQLGAERALVVHGDPGLDEISVCGRTHIARIEAGKVELTTMVPEDVGLTRVDAAALAGGDIADNVAIARRVLDGDPGPCRDAVLLNAGGALWTAGAATTIADGVKIAAETIDCGAAVHLVKRLAAFTTQAAAASAAAQGAAG